MITLSGFWNGNIVFLSILISVIGSFVTLNMNERIILSIKNRHNMWLKTTSLSLGLTIWTTHFVGIMAFTLPIPVAYHIPLIIASAMLAFLTAYLAFHVLSKVKKSSWVFHATAVVAGFAIAAIHYMGLMALKTEAYLGYNLFYVLVSIFLSVAGVYMSTWLFYYFKYRRSFFLKLLASLLVGAVLSSVHYASMQAAYFYVPKGFPVLDKLEAAPDFLIILVLLPISMIFLFMASLSFLDRKTALQLAYTDDLTSLPNRRKLEQFVEARTTPLNLPIAVVIIDIDNFKWINETYGYESGSKLISEFAGRLRHSTPQPGITARLEGNKFALAIPGTFSHKEIREMLNRQFLPLQEPFYIFGEPAQITFSAGVALAPEHGSSCNSLVLNAERALRHIKDNGKNEIVLYNPRFHDQDMERQIAMSFRKALENKEFYLCYQPKLNLHTNLIDSVEALVRWDSPFHGLVPPGKFIPIAEKNGFIFDLTKWILNEACCQMKQWKDENQLIERIAVNISAPMFLSDRLTETVKQTLQHHGLEACHLELEITETAIMEQFNNALGVIDALKQEGIAISLDDFGTGVSSLTYLKKLPIDQLKIDKSFIDDVHVSSEDKALVQMIIQLAKLFGLKVIAEGIEKEEQLDILKELGCDSIQGYFISRPERAEVLNVRYQKKANSL